MYHCALAISNFDEDCQITFLFLFFFFFIINFIKRFIPYKSINYKGKRQVLSHFMVLVFIHISILYSEKEKRT